MTRCLYDKAKRPHLNKDQPAQELTNAQKKARPSLWQRRRGMVKQRMRLTFYLGITWLLASCSLEFDASKIPGGGVRPTVDGSMSKPGEPTPADLAPLALWWFADEGMPAVVPDRAKGGFGVDMFPVLSSDVGRGTVEQGVWNSDRGVFRSDPGPATKLGAAIGKSQAISLEAWAEGDQTFEGKGNVVGCEFFNILQTKIGTEGALDVQNGSTASPVTLLPPFRLRHIVITYSAASGIQRLYMDANETVKVDMRLKSDSRTNVVVPSGEIRASLGDNGWVGKLHLAAIYNKELTPAQVRTLFGLGSKRR
jgi:hypothetical protein